MKDFQFNSNNFRIEKPSAIRSHITDSAKDALIKTTDAIGNCLKTVGDGLVNGEGEYER